jgi:hypothetical protein
MRILLDEQLPRQLARHLVGHEVHTVHQNLEYQQNLKKCRLGIVVLGAPSNALEDLLPLVARALAATDQVRPGQVLRITT